MISSTSNFNAHRRFTLTLLIITLLSMTGFVALGLYVQPNNGSTNEAWLVRNGGYAGRDYSWNMPQQAFIQPLYSHDHYDRYYDTVILGDSFTDLYHPYQWQNYLAAATNDSIMVFSLRRGARITDVLNNPLFQQHPPKLFIYEIAERYMDALISNLIPCNEQPQTLTKAVSDSPPKPHSHAISWGRYLANRITFINRDTQLHLSKLDELISHTKKYLWRNFLRNVLDIEITNTVKHKLTRSAPFSSRNTQTLLTSVGDLNKQYWNATTVQKIVCEIEHARQQIEANGKTRFVMLIAPDKLTAYADFLNEQKLQHISYIADVANRLPTTVLRMDRSLQAAIHAGEIDVYLPDDTHWGWRGHQIAAETLLDFLQTQK
ncbi:MAG: hypothetical protein QX197_07385 [Methylococcaceae bacterium]